MSDKIHDEWLVKKDTATQRYPNHCRVCRGSGEISYNDDPSDSGVSLSSGFMTFTETCECVTSGKCPRCGSALDPYSDSCFCTECKWDIGQEELYPEEPEGFFDEDTFISLGEETVEGKIQADFGQLDFDWNED